MLVHSFTACQLIVNEILGVIELLIKRIRLKFYLKWVCIRIVLGVYRVCIMFLANRIRLPGHPTSRVSVCPREICRARPFGHPELGCRSLSNPMSA